MRSVLRWMFAFVLVLAIGVPNALGQAGDRRQRISRGELIIGYQSDAQNLDPRKSRITPDLRVNTLIHSSLVRATREGLKPDLATEWRITNPTTYVFTLRRDVKFHDGSLLTSEDVKYTYDTMRDPAFASPDLGTFSVIQEIQTPNATTVVFRLKEPRASFLNELWRGIVQKKYAEANAAAVNLKPMGSGPYRFVEWTPNTRLVLEAFPDYYEGRPPFSRITFVPIADNTARILQLETGAVDLAWTSASADVARLKRAGTMNIYEVPGSTADFVQLNAGRPALRDVRVRRAIAYAINRKEISEVVYFGLTTSGASPIMPSSPFFERNVENFPYNPSRAKALLTEAGHPNGLTIELEHLAEATVQQYSELIQNQLARAGIRVVLKPREAGTIIRDWSTANYDMITFGLGNRPDPDAILYPRFHSESIVPKGFNAAYSNPEVDRLLDQARRESNEARRKALYSQAQKVIVRDVPILILTYKPEYVIGPKELQNISYDPFNLFFEMARKASWRR